MAAISKVTPVSGLNSMLLTCAETTKPVPVTSSTTAIAARNLIMDLPPCPRLATSGSPSWRSRATSSGEALRQTRTRPASAMTGGQDNDPTQATLSSEAISSSRASAEATAAVSERPACDVGLLAFSGYQQPGKHVDGRAEAARQRGEDEGDPDHVRTDAGTRGKAGGDAARQPTLLSPAQRPWHAGPHPAAAESPVGWYAVLPQMTRAAFRAEPPPGAPIAVLGCVHASIMPLVRAWFYPADP